MPIGPKCTPLGHQALAVVLLSILLIVLGFVFQAAAVPNGELKALYTLDACLNSSATFPDPRATQGARPYRVWTLRQGTEGELPSTACPTTFAAAAPQSASITLEETDGGSDGVADGRGYRKESEYHPTFFLPSGAYALVSYSLVDTDGTVLLPTATVSIGPDAAYPWAANGGAAGRRRLLSLGDEGAGEEAMAAAVAAVPGGRRLLKGGSSGGGLFGSGSKGSSSRWGSSTPSRTTYSPSSTYSSSGVRYGGSSSYYAGGRSYYTGR